jgi:hypothetical protein
MDFTDDERRESRPTELSDAELEQELTIAASRRQRDDRYEELLAETERRRGSDPRD